MPSVRELIKELTTGIKRNQNWRPHGPMDVCDVSTCTSIHLVISFVLPISMLVRCVNGESNQPNTRSCSVMKGVYLK
jgi:hypothetical protein